MALRVGGVCHQSSQHKSKVRKVSRVASQLTGDNRQKVSRCSNRPGPTKKCPTVPTDRVRLLAKNLATRSCWGGLWGVHEQYLSDLWATGHAVLCAWKPERRSFTHSKSHDWLQVTLGEIFSGAIQRDQDHTVWGLGLTQ
jgi:hypothetical protein